MPIINARIDGDWKEVNRGAIPETTMRVFERGDKQFIEQWQRDITEVLYKNITDAAWIQGKELGTWERSAKATWTAEERLSSIVVMFADDGVATCSKTMRVEAPEWERVQTRMREKV